MNPINTRIIIIPEKAQGVSSDTFVIPDSVNAKEKPSIGLVLSVGEKVKLVKPKEKVIFNKFNATHITLGDEKVLIIEEEDIYATIQD